MPYDVIPTTVFAIRKSQEHYFLVLFTYTLDASNEGRICYTHDHEGRKKVS